MTIIRQLVENKSKLEYETLCKALIQQFGVNESISWDSVLPAPQQQELFGGEVLRLIETHPELAKQKDIRPICLKKGSISQMLFFYITLSDNTLPKKQVEQITKRFIKGAEANRYIIWFFGNKDSTDLKVVLSGKEGKKIVLKTLPFGVNQPYYKTYDYILSEVQLKVQQLFVEPIELWKALWRAFDISILNRKFYDEIYYAFDLLIKEINKKGNPFESDYERKQFSIRLIGRIIFCWFLKRKGILKEDVLSSAAVEKFKNGNYYHDLLEPLFFEVMNKPEKQRRGGLPKLIAHYPFLNGGLFDAQENDYYNDRPNLKLQIGNQWFSQFFGNTLERYNFTVDENSSSSAEIAIDPEMLGRIFENLLAEQNPETGESARKATGSFYTPREIVDYMVEQSIAEYLKAKLTTPSINDAIDDMVHTNQVDELDEHLERITEELDNMKILDPACGSGAYPIGVLQKLIALKQEIWRTRNPKKQIGQAIAYKQKLTTIQNSIYGVDIQPMAVELSRLRCWLSLVVDEEEKNIKPLPNLDFKFVCADTLIDVPEDDYVKNLSENSLKDFTIATGKYFDTDFADKKELKKRIQKDLGEIIKAHDTAINQIISRLKKERNSATASRLKKLEKDLITYSKQQAIWHSYENIFKNKKVDFFNKQYFFPSASKGFDLVIGNPPYVQIQKLADDVKEGLENQLYKTYSRTGDLYQLFYERGFGLLKDGGHLCYITSNKWMRADYGEVTREYFATVTNTKVLVDFGMSQNFESATTYTNILLAQKSSPDSTIQMCRVKNDFNLSVPLTDYITLHAASINNPGKDGWVAYNKDEYPIIKIVEEQGVPLTETVWGIDINYGIKTGFNEAFIIPEVKKDELIKADAKNSEIIKPLLRGEDVKPYVPAFAGQWLINSHNGIKEKSIPPINVERDYKSIFKWLKIHEVNLKKRQDKGDHWTNLRNCAYIEEFAKPKIIFPNMTKFLPFVYDETGYLTNQKCFIMTGRHLKYLTGVFNSKLWKFSFRNRFPELLGDTYELSKVFFEKIPIKRPESKLQEDVVSNLVDYIIKSKTEKTKLNEFVPNDHIAKQFEDLIDACVYELYFKQSVKEKDAEVIDWVARDFTSITDASKLDQIEAIKKGYQILRDSSSEINQRITRQKLVPEIVVIQKAM